VVPCDSQGLRVLRGPDGAIQQAMTEKTCCFVSANDKRITVERYQAPDCKVAEDGSMVRMSWAECNNRIEVRELAPGPEPNTRTFETKQFHPEHAAGKFNLYVTELSETAARSQVLTRIYKGEQAVPEALIRQELLQRVILKEGMGYRQIIKIEKLNPAGVMVPDTHVIETWRVEPNGGRRLADRQELIKPARDEDTAEEH